MKEPPKVCVIRLISSRPTLLRLLARFIGDSRYFTLLRYSEYRPIQIRSEILALASLLRSRRTLSILEVGTAHGGTSLLLGRTMRTPCTFVTVDLEPCYESRRLRRAHLSRVDLHLVAADSQIVSTVAAVEAISEKFDAILVDGDHSYQGVRIDTLLYLPLLRPGGVLIFHDIQPLQEGDPAAIERYVGGVPSWWSQLSAVTSLVSHEFVASRSQSGFGIGVLEIPTSQAECAALGQMLAALPEQSAP